MKLIGHICSECHRTLKALFFNQSKSMEAIFLRLEIHTQKSLCSENIQSRTPATTQATEGNSNVYVTEKSSIIPSNLQ